MTPDLVRNLKLDLLQAYATSLDFTGKIAEKDRENAEVVSEVAMLLSAARKLGPREDLTYDLDRLLSCKEQIVRAAMRGWDAESLPYLKDVLKILDTMNEESTDKDGTDKTLPSAEGPTISLALGAALSNLARICGVLSEVLAVIEESRFKNYFDHDRLLRIGEAVGNLGKELVAFRLPDLSKPDL